MQLQAKELESDVGVSGRSSDLLDLAPAHETRSICIGLLVVAIA